MLAVTRLLLLAVLLIGVISIAATLWLEFHRDEKRRRRLKNVQSALNHQDVPPTEDTHFKRAA
jgi:hypothetical protein